MGRTPSRAGQLGATYDTPRGFGDEPMSIDQELAIELESVKRERQQLMDSIAQVKAEAGAGPSWSPAYAANLTAAVW